MNPEWIKSVKDFSIGALGIAALIYGTSLWHEERRYTAETDRRNQEKMASVITESLSASREDRRQLTLLSKDMMEKLRSNEQAEKAILASLQEIIELIKQDRSELKGEIQDIIDQLEVSTKSVTKELRR